MDDKPEQTSAPRPVDVASSGPAVWCNKFVVAIGGVVRITFLEQSGPTEPEYFRAAVVMGHPDAIAFKNLLTNMLTDIEKQIQALQTAQAGAGTPPNV